MTTSGTSSPGDQARGAVLRGIGALLALATLIAGPPATLIAVVGNPLPDQAVVGGQLTDAAVIGVLAVIVWAAWAQLMLVLAIEGAAAVRGGALPRPIPLCGFQQHLARHLVVAASLLLAGGGSVITATIAAGPAAAAAAPSSPVPCDAAPTAFTPPPPQTLHELATATPPAEAAPPIAVAMPHAHAEDSDPTQDLWYVVKEPHGHHHDSLWDIAERHLGDGLRWRDIYDLNKHRPQPDGRRLEMARLIQPGWRLLMPADATGILAKAQPAPVAQAHSTPWNTAPAKPAADIAGPVLPHARVSPDPVDSTAAGQALADPQTPAARTAEPAPAQVHAVTSTGENQNDNEHESEDQTGVPFEALTLGLGAIACAALTAELTRRRRRAQRHRRPGERLRTPSAEAQSTERVLRTANAELTVAGLRDALRSLADTCVRQGRRFPDVHAIRLNATTATLLLGADETEAVAPFESTAPRTWALNKDLMSVPDGLGGAEGASDRIDPYPALVALGVSDDSILLVNFEAAGTLQIDGETDAARAVLHALVAELGTSDLTPTVQLGLTGCPPELVAILDSGRVTVLDEEHITKWAQARLDDVEAILNSAEVADVAAARSSRIASDIWAPAVLIDAGYADVPEVDVRPPASPHSGLCALTLRRPATENQPGWTLRPSNSQWVLEPHGISLVPQRLDLASLPSLVDMLNTQVEPNTSITEASPPAPAESATISTRLKDDHQPRDETPEQLQTARAEESEAGIAEAQSDRGSAGPAAAAKPLAPRVLVLGPVDILGVDPGGAPGRRRRATELVAYLALHPGATQYQLDEALWPGVRVSRNTRNPLVSRTRQWLGTATDGQPHLALVGEGGSYHLSAEVSTDWHDFCALAKRGLASGSDGIDDLVAALDLVRGRPFLGVNPVAYAWAETDTQEMISAIVDVAHALAELAFDCGDFRRGRWAAAKGLDVDSCAEVLYQDGIAAAREAGDEAEVSRLVAQLRARICEIDPDDDLCDATQRLLAEAAAPRLRR